MYALNVTSFRCLTCLFDYRAHFCDSNGEITLLKCQIKERKHTDLCTRGDFTTAVQQKAREKVCVR